MWYCTVVSARYCTGVRVIAVSEQTGGFLQVYSATINKCSNNELRTIHPICTSLTLTWLNSSDLESMVRICAWFMWVVSSSLKTWSNVRTFHIIVTSKLSYSYWLWLVTVTSILQTVATKSNLLDKCMALWGEPAWVRERAEHGQSSCWYQNVTEHSTTSGHRILVQQAHHRQPKMVAAHWYSPLAMSVSSASWLQVVTVWNFAAIGPSLVPRLPPSFLSHTVQKTGREPGRFHHVHNDVLCLALRVVWVIELSPMHVAFEALTVLETELPCWLSRWLMPLTMTGRSPWEATTNNCEPWQHLKLLTNPNTNPNPNFNPNLNPNPNPK